MKWLMFLRAHVDLVRQVDQLHRDVRRLTYERDEALGLAADLREDLVAAERVNAWLMRACPSDLRELDTEVGG